MQKVKELIQSAKNAGKLFYKWLRYCFEMLKLPAVNAPEIWRKYPQSHYKIIFAYIFLLIPLWILICAGKLAEYLDDALAKWIEE